MRAFGALLARDAAPRGLVGFGERDVEDHLVRSLVLLSVLGRPVRLVDVGSGAGLPGVLLAIALGSAVLIEPRRKAAAFLEAAARELDIDLTVVVSGAEEASRGPWRDTADAVVARAVGAPATAAELCSPLCAPGGLVLLTAAPDARPGDIPARVCEALGLGPPEARTLAARSADGAISQRVLMMSKLVPTPGSLPRRPGLARRRPLPGDSRS